MRRIAAEVSGASTGELVEAVGVIALEPAGREAPGSAVACMELAERLGSAIDLGEAALAGLVARVDVSGEVHRWGFSSTSAWLRNRLGMRALPEPSDHADGGGPGEPEDGETRSQGP